MLFDACNWELLKVLDKINGKILALLAKDGRMSAAAIGRVVGLSRPAVQDRIARLEQEGIIEGYSARIVVHAGGVRAVLFVTIAERPCEPALLWLSGLPGIVSVESLAGELDALVHVLVPDMDALSALNDMVGKGSFISNSRSQVILKRY